AAPKAGRITVRAPRTVPADSGVVVADRAGAAAGTSATTKPTFPNRTTSPRASGLRSTRAPFTNVPLLEPRSCTSTPASPATSSACRRETVESTTGASLVGARPTTSDAPGRSSIVWPPSTAVRRMGIAKS
ncbi:MAG: hypothetical protein AVDCRST_MAG11-63, partial [uncultured Gemmatimonadaceae bacterium]